MINGTTSEQAIEAMIMATLNRVIPWKLFSFHQPDGIDPRYGVDEAYSADYEGLKVILYRIRKNNLEKAMFPHQSYFDNNKPFQETLLDIKDAKGESWRIPYTQRLDELMQAVRRYLGTSYPPANVLEKLAKFPIPPSSPAIGLSAH